MKNQSGTAEPRGDLAESPEWLSIARALVVLGMILRMVQYLANRSIWRDEAALALNLRWRSWGELLGPLDFAQSAPAGYLLLMDGLTSLFGDHEYVLRLPALLASLAALVLFFRMARKVLSPMGVALAMALLAFCPVAIYWSADAKPYSLGLLSTVLILLLITEDVSSRKLIAAGVLAWFSQTAVFVLASTGLILLLRRGRRALPVIAGWMLLVIPPVLLSLYATSGEVGDYLHTFWRDGFIQYGSLLDTVVSVVTLPLLAIASPLGFRFPVMLLVACLMAVGGWSLRRNPLAPYVLLPTGLTFLAAALGLYPFGGGGFAGRAILFLVPLWVLVLSAGTLAVETRHTVTGAVIALVLLQSLPSSDGTLPYKIDDQRGLMRYAIEHASPGDRMYVDFLASHALEYYRPRWGHPELELIRGTCTPGPWPLFRGDRALLEGGRVWVVETGPPHLSHLSQFLAKEGRQLDTKVQQGGAVSLIDVPDSLPPVPEWPRPDIPWLDSRLDCRGHLLWPDSHGPGSGTAFGESGSG